MTPADLTVVSGASLDVIHAAGRRHRTVGGAGLYTALAAAWVGARVRMIAPRPAPMPASLAGAAARIAWEGPRVTPDALPRFEIVQRPDGRMVMPRATWGAEAELSPDALPAGALDATIVYCGPLADPARQLAFLRRAHAAGTRIALGTYPRAVEQHLETVREGLALAELFFCNEIEATRLFGGVDGVRARPGQIIFVTRGAAGALVVRHGARDAIPPVAVEARDPTGAGDTFCGVTLGEIARGVSPLLAARRGAACAARVVGAIGPAALLGDAPPPPAGDPARVRVDPARVAAIARLIATLPEVRPFEFTGADFPAPDDPAALDYFFASVLQQFGFWHDDGTRYTEPMIAPIGGVARKGSDFLWAAYRRWLDESPVALTPSGQAALDLAALDHATRDDGGRSPLPALEARLALARRYGRDMAALGWSPAGIVAAANASPTPLRTLLEALDHVGGYAEDPLRKKAVLLALILRQRPEGWLRVEPEESVPPVIDYHLQRSCLRTGLIEVRDATLREALVGRRVVAPEDEWAVRVAAYGAVAALVAESGRSMGAVDWFFFGARRFCPEMREPDCPNCPIEPGCARATRLFQPVIRTSFY